MDNRTIAERLRDYACQLEDQKANLYRIKAYRRAAATVLGLDQPVSSIVAHQGRAGLRALPGVGAHLSHTIDTLVRTGEFPKEDNAAAAALPIGDGRPILGLRLAPAALGSGDLSTSK